jgi:hypothetical protein
MKSSAQILARSVKALRLGSLVLTLALSSGGRPDMIGQSSGALVKGPISSSAANTPARPAIAGRPHAESDSEVTRHALSFGGDRSLDVAIAVDEIRTAYTRYTIRLRVTSGSEQSIAVSAPTGGLQPEVRDMTGDNVRNDLILAPKLLQWPLTVLVNDGHDHFVLAVSAAAPDSLASKEAEMSRHGVPTAAALTSSGFKTDALSSDGRLFLPQPQQTTARSTAQSAAKRLSHPASSGRDPPTIATEI